MTLHTPGPWDRTYKPDHSYVEPITVWGNSRPVAFISPRGALKSEDVEREANAKLIAAAPDLLKALTALLSHNRSSDGCIVFMPREVEQARAAIAKAATRANAFSRLHRMRHDLSRGIDHRVNPAPRGFQGRS